MYHLKSAIENAASPHSNSKCRGVTNRKVGKALTTASYNASLIKRAFSSRAITAKAVRASEANKNATASKTLQTKV